jgi:hypothetical protein
MTLPRHPKHLDTITKPARPSNRRRFAIGAAIAAVMATVHFLRQAM